MPTPAIDKIQLLTADGLVGVPINEYAGHWIVHLPAITSPPGDGLINELDFFVEVPGQPGVYANFYIGNDVDGDPSRFAVDQVIDSTAPPAWVTYIGNDIGSDVGDTSINIFDGGWNYNTFTPVTFITVDAVNSDPAWYQWIGDHISGFTPASGTILDSFVIHGSGFTGATAVQVGGVGGVAYTVDSDTQITTEVPYGSTPGYKYVFVHLTAGGIVQSATQFLVGTPPTLTGFTPLIGPAGATVTVSGSGFTAATAVTLGASSVVFNVVDDATVTFTVPTGVSGGRISVTTPLGTASSVGAFMVGRPASPVLRGYTRKSVADNGSSTVPFDVPAGTRDGDFLLFLAVQHSPTIVGNPYLAETAWVVEFDQYQFSENSGGYFFLGDSGKMAVSEPASYNLLGCAVGAGVDLEILCFCYKGAAGFDRGNVVHSTSPSPTVVYADVDANFPGDRYVAAAAAPDQGGVPLPPFNKQTVIIQIARPTISLTVSEEILPTPGVFGTNTRSTPLAVSSPNVAAAVTIQPGSVVATASAGRTRLWKDRG